MTEEEFNSLPCCIRYENPEKECRRLNNDDWDELVDVCHECTGNKYFARRYYPDFINRGFQTVVSGIGE